MHMFMFYDVIILFTFKTMSSSMLMLRDKYVYMDIHTYDLDLLEQKKEFQKLKYFLRSIYHT